MLLVKYVKLANMVSAPPSLARIVGRVSTTIKANELLNQIANHVVLELTMTRLASPPASVVSQMALHRTLTLALATASHVQQKRQV